MAVNLATAVQKEFFKEKFAEIVKGNETLNNKYVIQFFDTLAKTNYVIKGLDGKSLNVINSLSIDELENYRVLKLNWHN